MRSFILCLLCLFAACSQPAPLKAPKTLRTCFFTYPTTVDPRKSSDFVSSTLMCLLYEGLMRTLPGDAVECGIAERVEISENQLIYTFFLKEALWSDGTKVTAHDFAASWISAIDPKFPCLCSYLFFPIKNAEACIQGKAPLSSLGIQTIGERVLQVELERPCPYFLSLTAFPLYLPIPTHQQRLVCSSDLVSNGPYRLSEVLDQERLVLKKNPDFWNQDHIYFDTIQIDVVPDEMSALHLFEAKQLDFVGGALSALPIDALETLQKQNILHSLPMAATTFCTFNTQRAPFKSQKMRQALSAAVSHEIVPFGQIPATTLLPPSLKSVKLPSKENALTLFASALEEMGIHSPCELPPLTLIHKAGASEKRMALILKKTWEERFGIVVYTQPLDPKTHLHRLHQKEYDLALASWICQFHDPINILERYRLKTNPKNYPDWYNEEYDTALTQASLCTTSEERALFLEKAMNIFVDALPLIPIYHWSSFYLQSEDVPLIPSTVNGGILFERASSSGPKIKISQK